MSNESDNGFAGQVGEGDVPEPSNSTELAATAVQYNTIEIAGFTWGFDDQEKGVERYVLYNDVSRSPVFELTGRITRLDVTPPAALKNPGNSPRKVKEYKITLDVNSGSVSSAEVKAKTIALIKKLADTKDDLSTIAVAACLIDSVEKFKKTDPAMAVKAPFLKENILYINKKVARYSPKEASEGLIRSDNFLAIYPEQGPGFADLKIPDHHVGTVYFLLLQSAQNFANIRRIFVQVMPVAVVVGGAVRTQLSPATVAKRRRHIY